MVVVSANNCLCYYAKQKSGIYKSKKFKMEKFVFIMTEKKGQF